MIVITCSSCSKPLKVKDELAGKRVKCPSCGQAVTVPVAEHTLQPSDGLRPTAPRPDIKAPEQYPAPPDSSEEQTVLPSQRPEATQNKEVPDGSSELQLTEFLGQALADDELGRLGHYRILKILGHGGMGVVYKADDPKLKRTVAIKAMLPTLAASASAGKRFLREAQAMAALKHDHIVTIYQVDEDRGVPFLAMEFLAGEPLDQRLRREEKLSLPEVMRLGREIAEALESAHATGLIHRDVKPANIWLEAPRDRVKILDFGLARAASNDSQLTQQGAIVGTPAYMAPEQARGEKLDGRSDLFSLGVVLYRLCTGNSPFKGNDTISTLMAVATLEPPAPHAVNPDVPAGLSDLVMQLLKKDAAKRPASANVVVTLIQRLERKWVKEHGSTPSTEELEPPPAPFKEPPRRRRWPMIAAALAALALVVLGVVVFWPTANGTVRIEVNDDDIKVAIDQGDLKITGVDKQDIVLAPGEHGLRVKRGDIEFNTEKFVLRKGETVTLKVELLPGKVQVVQGDKVIGGKELPPTHVAVAPNAVHRTTRRMILTFEAV